tara:strand:- start:119 stop:241 length:123 start_codon:yes stop_codon:yes gene_type:complete
MLVLFGIALGIALNQIRILQKRVNEIEEFIGEVFFDDEEK